MPCSQADVGKAENTSSIDCSLFPVQNDPSIRTYVGMA